MFFNFFAVYSFYFFVVQKANRFIRVLWGNQKNARKERVNKKVKNFNIDKSSKITKNSIFC